MSKRPRTATAVLSRLRRPVGRLRDLPIWSKLGLIMIVPTIATIIVGTNGLIVHIETSNNADRARTLSRLSSDVGLLVHNLQDERAAATRVLSTPATGQAASPEVDAYRKGFPATDQAQRSYTQRRNGLADLPPSFGALLKRLDNQLSTLPSLRDKVSTRKDVSLTFTAFYYRVLIADLLAIRDSSAQLAGETSLSDRMRAAAAVSTVKEFLAQERVVVLRVLAERVMSPARERDFVSTLTGQDQAINTFSVVATPGERTIFDQEVAGDDLRLAEKYEGQIESILNGGQVSDLQFNAEQWDAATRERSNLLRNVEQTLDNQMEAQATDLRDAVVRQVLIETGLLLGMLLLAILFAWLVARSMARSLRELRHGALAVAQYGLPQAVARLRDPALASQMSPAQVAQQIAEPLPVRSKDEFGQVAEAFNAVHMEAVRTAAEQASLRASVATMFVNLARRSQLLVDRLIGHLDHLERGEEDPDRLGELFQLDHLATRMRRNDENLLVLAGADSTRVQREPAALLDVLRAAQSEVEHYTRTEFGVIDRDIEVAAHAVNDLVHLVAELLDNATAFSPPESAVIVEARRVGDRAVLLVEDRGIGVSPDQLAELNERLTKPPMVDVTVSRMMGLVVVARLASRHGVKVELRRGRERGTVADVTLPTSVLVPRALTGRLAAGRDLPAHRGEPQSPPSRPAFGAPLALESGPSAPPRVEEPLFRGFDSRTGDAGRGFDGGRRLADAAPGAGGGNRGLPAWSDLTGAAGVTGANGTDPFGAAPPRAVPNGDPLPQRRPGEARTVEGEVTGAPPQIPRQIPNTPEARPNGFASGPDAPPVPPVSAPPVPVSSPPVSGPPGPYVPPPGPYAPPPGRPDSGLPTRPGAAPPAWPPVAPATDDQSTPPPVPGELAAALDMTAEIPKVRPENGTPVPPMSTAPAPDPRAARFADETMELPIFRELESAWFRTRRAVPEPPATGVPGGPAPAQGAPAPSAPPTTAGSTSRVSKAQQRRPSGPSGAPAEGVPANEPAGIRVSGQAGWQTAADEGWRAAAAATDVTVADRTEAGLPKRVPMAQLVPGGVDKGASNTQRRSPEAVRGLLSAYHRGVQRGRTQPKGSDSKTPEPTTAGQQTSQAGKEHEG